jgi:hypothetical protein
MRKLLVLGLAAPACVALLATSAFAFAIAIQPNPGPVRVAIADTIVVGRVMGLEDKDIEVPAAPGVPNMIKYRIAVVGVAETIKGGKVAETIRVGFFPPPMQGTPPGGPIRPGRPQMTPSLKTGQEVLLYLSKHHTGSFYTVPGMYDVTPKENANFAKEVSEAREFTKLLQDPMGGLKSSDAQTRFRTAALLISLYRQPQPGPVRTEPISAEESKLILLALADADWTPQPVRPATGAAPLQPLNLFFQLGLSQKDGWTPPRNPRDTKALPDAARAWLRANAGTYRIQRYVPTGTPGPRTTPGGPVDR